MGIEGHCVAVCAGRIGLRAEDAPPPGTIRDNGELLAFARLPGGAPIVTAGPG